MGVLTLSSVLRPPSPLGQTAVTSPRVWKRLAPQAGATIALADVVALAAGLAASGLQPVLVAHASLVLMGQWLGGAYRFRLNVSFLRELPRTLAGIAVPLLVMVPAGMGTGTTEVLLRGAAVSGGALVLMRSIAATLVLAQRRRGRMRASAIILGSGAVAMQLARRFAEHPDLGLDVVGYLDDGDDAVAMPVPRLGEAHDLDDVVRETGVAHVVAAFCHAREQALVDLLRIAREADVDVHVVPRFFELAPGGTDRWSEDVWGIPLHRLPPPGHRAVGRHLKRGFDIVVSALVLLLAAPLLCGVALAVRGSSPGPVLFRQRRLGQHGREFELLKFRSMQVNTDSDTTWSVATDARVTRVGQFLRDKSLDELPQLINVLRGDMSLVGPRPERPTFVDEFTREIDSYAFRHRVPVGLTGWAQIHGLRGDTSIADRAQFDNNYIENWSLWSDLAILARTVGTVLRGQS